MLDGLLKDQIRKDAQIAGMLARYNDIPAFFFQKAPQDTDPGWQKPAFPRADYNIDMRYDPERKAAGIMSINVWATAESAAMPEDIERRLIDLIDGTFYSKPGQPTVCALWNRSEAFGFEMPANVGGNTAPEVIGITIIFDLLSFPEQLTTDPDPVQGLNFWTKGLFPAMNIIGHDEMPPIWKPTDEAPAIYWRFESAATNDKQTFAANWYTGEFAAHVITENVTERNRWTKAIIEQLQLWGEIVLVDESPMFAKQIKIRHAADPLREGQLVLTGMYGVLAQSRKIPAKRPLNRAILSHEHTGLEVNSDGRHDEQHQQ
jgi:hypothetical protein